jgi:hypothetical protein
MNWRQEIRMENRHSNTDTVEWYSTTANIFFEFSTSSLIKCGVKAKGKAIPVTGHRGP